MVYCTVDGEIVAVQGGYTPEPEDLDGKSEVKMLMIATYRATQFIITVPDATIRNASFGERLWVIFNDPNMNHESRWREEGVLVLRYCMSLITSLPFVKQDFETLEDYIHTPTYKLLLSLENGSIVCSKTPGPEYKPSYHLGQTLTSKLGTISERVVCYQASEIIVPLENRNPRVVSHRVILPDGTVAWFKPCLDGWKEQFEREGNVYLRIASLKLHGKARVANVLGVVVSEDGKSTYGILREWIPELLLADAVKSADKALLERWKKQIYDGVEVLHQHDLIWGNPNPWTVCIDAKDDAWMTSFEGVCNALFLGDDHIISKEGDIKGVRKIFEEWVPAQSVNS